MKNLLVTMMLALFAVTASADNNSNSNSTSQAQQSTSNEQGQGQGQGQGQYIDSHDTVSGSDLSRMVPAVSAPALTTTLTETCMGSTSAGVSWAGAGISFGTTWRDSACVRRLDARQIASIHPQFALAAKELMCDSDAVFEAFKRAGIPCAPRDGEVEVVEAKK